MGILRTVLFVVGMAGGLSAAVPAFAQQAAPRTITRSVMSLSYSPSGVTTWAVMERGFSEAALRGDLARLARYTGRIRTYSVDFGLDRVPSLARELNMKVSLGIWLDFDRAKNDREITRALAVIAAAPDVIDQVYVGNEAVVRGDLPAAEVAAYLQRVRAALKGRNVTVATAEPWHIWLKHPELAAASDFIGAHLFSYWDGVPVGDGVAHLGQRFDDLRATFPGKRVVISETGWPSRGGRYQAAEASPAAQADFTRAFLREAARKGYEYNIVEAYDQPWKAPEEGGAYWGIFTNDGTPKFAF